MSQSSIDVASPPPRTIFQHWSGLTLLFAAAYVAAGMVGLVLAPPPGHATLVWPPSGIALAAILIMGRRGALPVLIGAVVLNGYGFFAGAAPYGTLTAIAGTLAIAVGSVLQPLAAASLLRRLGLAGKPFASLAAIGRTLGSVGLACCISASIGTVTLVALALETQVGITRVWGIWWLGDLVGILLVTPVVMGLYRKERVIAILLALVVAVGVGGAYLVGNSIRSEAEAVWAENADSEARRLSATLVQWVETSSAPLQAMATLFGNSDAVSDEEFRFAIELLEENERGFFPSSLAVAVPETVDGVDNWLVVFSAGAGGRFSVGVDPRKEGTVGRAVLAALDVLGQTVIGSIEHDQNGAARLIPAIAVDNAEERYVVLGIIDLERLIDELFETQVPDGLLLRLSARIDDGAGQGAEVLYGGGNAAQDSVLTETVTSDIGTTRFTFLWDVTTEFQGGPGSALAEIVLAVGVIATTLLCLFINFFVRQNEQVRLLVQARTVELGEKEEQLRLTLDNTPGAIIYTDKDMNIVVRSEQLADMMSLPGDVLLPGKSYADVFRYAAGTGFYGDADPEKLAAAGVESVRNPPKSAFDMAVPGGRYLSVIRKKVAGGGVVSAYTDVTERRLAEERSKEAERRIRAFSEANPDLMLVLDEHGIYVDIITAASGTLVGGSREKLIGTNITAHFSAAKAQHFLDAIRKCLDDDETQIVEYEITEDQSVVWFEGSVAPIQTDAGAEKLVIWVARDVTERKLAEERSKEAERRLRAFTAAVPDQMLVFDEDGTYVDIINPKNDLLARSREALIGTHLSDYFTPDKAQFFVDGIQKSIAEDEAIKVEYRITEGGSDLWLEGSIAPIQTDAGSKKLVMFISRDITERKVAEQELSRAHSMITESLTYASRIQRSLLPPKPILDEIFADHALFWEPKDVVGGDMAWVRPATGGIYLVVADCTGHGPPGAFMTMISTGALDRALADMKEADPAELIHRMNVNIKMALGQDRQEGESDDGVELGVVHIDADRARIIFAGARFTLTVANDGELEAFKGDRSAIGYRHIPMDATFANHTIAVAAGKAFYMWTDGVVDQIGGPKRRSFGNRRVRAIIEKYGDRPMPEQVDALRSELRTYQQAEMRRDDMTFIGFVPRS